MADNTDRVSDHHRLLSDLQTGFLSEELQKDNVQKWKRAIKTFYPLDLPVHEKTTIQRDFDVLESRGHIKVGKYDVLKKIFSDIDKRAVNMIQKVEDVTFLESKTRTVKTKVSSVQDDSLATINEPFCEFLELAVETIDKSNLEMDLVIDLIKHLEKFETQHEGMNKRIIKIAGKLIEKINSCWSKTGIILGSEFIRRIFQFVDNIHQKYHCRITPFRIESIVFYAEFRDRDGYQQYMTDFMSGDLQRFIINFLLESYAEFRLKITLNFDDFHVSIEEKDSERQEVSEESQGLENKSEILEKEIAEETEMDLDQKECQKCASQSNYFCIMCAEKMCRQCIPAHLDRKTGKGHYIKEYKFRNNDTVCNCMSHPEVDCHSYCRSCDIAVCELCITDKHKLHQLGSLADVLDYHYKEMSREEDKLLNFARPVCQRILDHFNIRVSEIDNFFRRCNNEIITQGEKWHKEINDIVTQLSNQLQELKKEHLNLIYKQKTFYEEFLNEIDESIVQIASLRATKDIKEFLKFTPRENYSLEDISLQDFTLPKFTSCKISQKYLKTNFGDIEEAQKCKVHLNDLYLLDNPTISTAVCAVFPPGPKMMRLYSMAYLGEDMIWVGGYSKELKLYNLSGWDNNQVMCNMDLENIDENLEDSVSISVCGPFISQQGGNILYSDYKEHTVKKVTEYKKTEIVVTTDNWVPRGITCTSSDELLVCLCALQDQGKVVRYSEAGEVLQEIQVDSHNKPLYCQPQNIAVNKNGDICTTDYRKKVLTTVDRTGIFRFTYNGKNSNFDPTAVTTDRFCNIIIADWKNLIHLINKDGQFLRYIQTDTVIEKPHAVCINMEGQLLVGECMSGIIFKIKYLE